MDIATYNYEITLGIEAPDGNTDIHTHISCYEEEDINDSFSKMINMINLQSEQGKLFYTKLINQVINEQMDIDSMEELKNYETGNRNKTVFME